MSMRAAVGVCFGLAAALVAAAPVFALSCEGIPPFLEIVRRDQEAIILRVKVAEQTLIEIGDGPRKMRLPVVIGEVAESYRGVFGKVRVMISGGTNGNSGIEGLRPGSEWVLVGSKNPRLPSIDLWLNACSGNALAVKGRIAEGFITRWQGHDGTGQEQIGLNQLRRKIRASAR